jgi:hypothetical protein
MNEIKYNKTGEPRKERQDKGKKRGPISVIKKLNICPNCQINYAHGNHINKCK